MIYKKRILQNAGKGTLIISYDDDKIVFDVYTPPPPSHHTPTPPAHTTTLYWREGKRVLEKFTNPDKRFSSKEFRVLNKFVLFLLEFLKNKTVEECAYIWYKEIRSNANLFKQYIGGKLL